MPERSGLGRKLRSFLAHATLHRSAQRAQERERRDDDAGTDPHDRGSHEIGDGGTGQLVASDDRHDAQQADARAQRRPGSCDRQRLEGGEPQQVRRGGPAEPQRCLFAAMRLCVDARTEHREDDAEQYPRESEEHEHAPRRDGVVGGHLEGIGDVVDLVMLPWCDIGNGACDRPCLRGGVSRCSPQLGAVHDHVNFRDGEVLQDRALLRARGAEGGDDDVPERRRCDDHGERHVQEIVELAGLAAGEQRQCLGQICHAADPHPQCGLPWQSQRERCSRIERQRMGGLGTGHGCTRLERSANQSDRRMALLVCGIEGEDPYGAAQRPTLTLHGPGREVHE